MLQETEHIRDDVISDKIFKAYKMKGLVSANQTAASLMDTSLESGRSDIVPVGFKQDGSFYSDSKIADEHTFQVLNDHLKQLILQAGIKITSGEITLDPYETE